MSIQSNVAALRPSCGPTRRRRTRHFAAPSRGERAVASGDVVGKSAHRAGADPFIIIALAITFLSVIVVLPLVVVFAQAFSKGIGAYFSALAEPEALSAIRLTLLVAAISVPLNLVFGVIAAWAITKFDFRGKTLPDHADRSAVLGLSGHLRPGLRAAVRRCRACWARG